MIDAIRRPCPSRTSLKQNVLGIVSPLTECPLLALSGHAELACHMSAFGGKADMPFCTQIHHQFGSASMPGLWSANTFMARIEPTDKDGEDRHTFECVSCDYAEANTLVKFR